MREERYFVPLGRERGGLLDVLGLSADATETQVKRKIGEHIDKIDQELRARNRELKARHKATLISPEELQAKLDESEKIRTDTRVEFSRIKGTYDAGGVQRRALRGAAAQEDDAWLPLCRFGSTEEFWDRLLDGDLLPQVEEQHVAQLRRRWFGSAQATECPILASSRCQDEAEPDLSMLVALSHEQAMVRLVAADLLWQRVRLTNREHWMQRWDQWIAQIEALGPSIEQRAQGRPESWDNWEYPGLCKMKDQMVRQLQAGEIKDFTAGVKRVKPPSEEMSLERFLAMLASAAGKEGASPGEGDPQAMGMSPEELKEFMRLLMGPEAEEAP